MSFRRNAVYVVGGLVAFVAASALMAVSTTVVNALIPQNKPDPPGEMQETLEDKGKRLAAEEAARNKAEKKDSGKEDAPTQTAAESPESPTVTESSGESAVVSAPAPPPPPPAPAPARGPGNMGYEPQYYPTPSAGGPGNLN